MFVKRNVLINNDFRPQNQLFTCQSVITNDSVCGSKPMTQVFNRTFDHSSWYLDQFLQKPTCRDSTTLLGFVLHASLAVSVGPNTSNFDKSCQLQEENALKNTYSTFTAPKNVKKSFLKKKVEKKVRFFSRPPAGGRRGQFCRF